MVSAVHFNGTNDFAVLFEIKLGESTGMPHFIVLHFVLHRCCIFLKIEGKTLHQQQDYQSRYCGGLDLNPPPLRGKPVH